VKIDEGLFGGGLVAEVSAVVDVFNSTSGLWTTAALFCPSLCHFLPGPYNSGDVSGEAGSSLVGALVKGHVLAVAIEVVLVANYRH